ncbi:MAG: DUF3016 domain-containing protein [Opitutaceae bacterium]|jgi:hypothetical protein
MKTLRLYSSILGLAAAGVLNAADNPAPRTVVVFDHPDNFTDVKDSYIPTEKGRDAILKTLRDFLVDRTESRIPNGYQLTITFTEINLAGKFEPWHNPPYDIRYLRPVYPPHFKFTYSVTDPSGKVVKSGSEDILDANYQMRVVIDYSDPLRYEKDILAEWARATLKGLPKP